MQLRSVREMVRLLLSQVRRRGNLVRCNDTLSGRGIGNIADGHDRVGGRGVLNVVMAP